MSEITRGVIGMPLDLAMASSLNRAQFHARAQALLADFDQLKAENEWLQKARIPAGFYRELLALRELRDKAKAYVEGYLQDEIEDVDACVSEAHHEAALELSGRLKDAFESYWDAAVNTKEAQ